MLAFTLTAQDPTSQARCGQLVTRHATLETPLFMPVGTYGTVRSLGSEELNAMGAKIILANAYHLFLRPGHEFLRDFKGLHRFMSWPNAILTDSGGYQLYSMQQLRNVSEQGVLISSHIDGTKHLLTPELVVEMQAAMGVDIAMPLDVFVPNPSPRAEIEAAMQRTLRWLKRAEVAKRDLKLPMFAIIQGGTDLELRRISIEESMKLDFSGVALGGFSVGEEKSQLLATLAGTLEALPKAKPRYLMGMGMPVDLVEAVRLGVDMFDCVLPTRNARNGMLFTRQGELHIKNAKYQRDEGPIDSECACFVCQTYSRAYIRYLFKASELLGLKLNSYHNVYYYLDLMGQMRRAIAAQQFESFRREFYEKRSQHHDETSNTTERLAID